MITDNNDAEQIFDCNACQKNREMDRATIEEFIQNIFEQWWKEKFYVVS